MKTITSIRDFPPETKTEALDREVAMRLDHGALHCWYEKTDTGFVLVTIRPGPDMIKKIIKETPMEPHPLNAAAAAISREAVAEADDRAAPLGVLSARFESNGDAAAIGEDSTGGPSYGAYQIATKTGTMDSFLSFLKRAFPAFHAPLDAAGGGSAARARTEAFVSAWRALADNPGFLGVQHGFIKATHYDPFLERIKAELRIFVDRRSHALKNVVWSTAVQHGPANRIFKNALTPNDQANSRRDKNIINAIYDERSNVDVYFKSSSESVKKAVRNRFADERSMALDMLLDEA